MSKIFIPIIGFKEMRYFLNNNRVIYSISALPFIRTKTVKFPQTALIVK